MINEDEYFPDRTHLVVSRMSDETRDELDRLVRKGIFATRTSAILTAIDQLLDKHGILESRVNLKDLKIE